MQQKQLYHIVSSNMVVTTLSYEVNRESSIPIHSQIKDRIKNMIDTGKLKPGDKVPPELELSHEFNVSRTTIRKAMESLVKEELIIRQPGKGSFVRNSTKEHDIIFDSRTPLGTDLPILLFLSFLGKRETRVHPCTYRILNGIEERLAKERVEVVQFVTGEDSELDLNGQLDNVVAIATAGVGVQGNLETLSSYGIPLIVFNSAIAPVDFYIVHSNDVLGGYIATKHLIECGARNPAIFTRSSVQVSHGYIDRYKGYRMALERHGIPYNEKLVFDAGPSYSSTLEVANELFKSRKDVDGIFTVTDIIASAVLNSAHQNGVNVPDDLLLVGYDNQRFARSCRPRLTSIEVPFEELGKKAAEIFLQLTRGHKIEQDHIEIKPRLIVREST